MGNLYHDPSGSLLTRCLDNKLGGFLKTHDFLQPLERVETDQGISKEQDKATEKSRPPGPPPTNSVEHIPPRDIGTYNKSYISYQNQRVPEPDGVNMPPAQATSSNRNDENSNSSSYTGSGFTLWDESVLMMNKGQTGKENSFDSKERHPVRGIN